MNNSCLNIQIIIKAFQAENGESFLVTIKGQDECNLLIDCGTEETYYQYIKPTLLEMGQAGKKIDYLILTHTHGDHIGGAIPFLIENGVAERAQIIKIGQVLYNGFLGLQLQNYEKRESNSIEKIIYSGICSRANAILGQGKNNKEITLSQELSISKLLINGKYCWNGSYNNPYKLVISNGNIPITISKGVDIIVLSPTLNNLLDMNKKWEEYLKRISSKIDILDNELVQEAYEAFLFILENEKYETITQFIKSDEFSPSDVESLARKSVSYDRTAENGSSIAFILRAGDKKILFLADANPEICRHSLDVIYPQDEEILIDLIKVPHHGSHRNLSVKLLEKYVTNKFLISSGKNSIRPSLEALSKLVYYSKVREKKFYITNRNSVICDFDTEQIHGKYSFEMIDVSNQLIIL